MPVPKQLPSHIAQALAWVPATVETIVVANWELTLPDPDKFEAKADIEALSFLTFVGLPQKGGYFKGLKADWAVMATRNARPASGIGLCPFDGVTIFAAEKSEIERVRASFIKASKGKQTILNREVHFIDEKGVDLWTYYLATESDHLIVATDKTMLEETLQGIDAPRKEPTHQKMLLWSKIDPAAPFWALRTFTDRSRKLSYGMNMGDDKLLAYAMQTDARNTQLSILQRTEAPQGNAHARLFWGNMDTQSTTSARFEEVDGDLNITFGPDKEDWSSLTFYLIAALGTPVFL